MIRLPANVVDMDLSFTAIMAANEKFRREYGYDANVVYFSYADMGVIKQIADLCWGARFFPAFVLAADLPMESWYVGLMEPSTTHNQYGSVGA